MNFEFDPIISDQTCPYCFRKNDAATAIDEKAAQQGVAPKEGDISICIGCAEISIYTEEVILRKFKEGDLTGISLAEIKHAQGLIREHYDTNPETIRTSKTYH